MILFLSKDISIYSFNNKNINYRKNYTLCYVLKAVLTESHSFAKDD